MAGAEQQIRRKCTLRHSVSQNVQADFEVLLPRKPIDIGVSKQDFHGDPLRQLAAKAQLASGHRVVEISDAIVVREYHRGCEVPVARLSRCLQRGDSSNKNDRQYSALFI